MESPKRLKSSKQDLIKLFANSSNQCSFPDCEHPLFYDNSVLVGELCHIEGVMPGSARHNENSTNEFRRSGENLILLCGHHHNIIDALPLEYTKERLLEMKEKHEKHNEKSGQYKLSERQLLIAESTLSEINENVFEILEGQRLSRHLREPIHYFINSATHVLKNKEQVAQTRKDQAIRFAFLAY